MKEISLASVITTSIWMFCLVVGVIGIVVPYAKPHFGQSQPPPLQAEILDVSLTTDSIPDELPAPPKLEALTPPPTTQPLAAPSAPALIPVAAPNPSIAFELPVTGPTRAVPASQASYSKPTTQPTENSTPQPAPTQLTFGHGEGKQPMTYPDRAQREGQEGIVRIVFTVGTNGKTLAAEIISASPWPLLNEAALKSVRERWSFTPGSIRRYEVPINFRIRK